MVLATSPPSAEVANGLELYIRLPLAYKGMSWGDLYLYRAQLEERRSLDQNRGFETGPDYGYKRGNYIVLEHTNHSP